MGGGAVLLSGSLELQGLGLQLLYTVHGQLDAALMLDLSLVRSVTALQ